jgi:guanylate kinase
MQKNLFVLSGPSGSGKNTVYNALTERIPELAHTVSATTREPRAGEICCVDYYYIPEEEFLYRVEHGDFIEYVNYGGNYYGTLKSEIERLTSMHKILVLIIEVNGALRFKELFPEAETIFIVPPSIEELKRRISGRGQNTDEELETRLAIAAAEMENRDKYDHCVVNDDLTQCIDEVYHIIKGEDQV